ncbi:helix-turn-helix transcriptional regulator [Serratia symbiotica]|uniref:Helix-turn-helix transcriptional regulator n=1 Tax=Serratia symbiotica TaxID=138074 RepID=A0A068ZB13_9GAMM|nr:AraC family transcriptional regulator [Serratia symbiotica]MBQ0956594.1 helix-turn-helix transcriptional regulator [Serratia symbiotica]QLH62591.1 helix-turn-helix transcriptional regulator [Serratia symbiotica]CDS58297.1 putative transcriptional regulator, AraC family [Serratia symbiotica]
MQSTHQLHSQQPLTDMTHKWGLPYGVDLCLNDLTANGDAHRSETLNHCLTILLTLDGDEPNYYLDDGSLLPVERGMAKVIANKDRLRLWCRNPRGHHSRSMVIQAAPERISDNELADQIERILQRNQVFGFVVPQSTIERANELFSYCDNCVIGRLQTRSCVLDLLAQVLHAAEQDVPHVDVMMQHRDVTRVLKVRDKLVSELDSNHCLGDLARDVGISVSALKSKFQAVMGQSVFAFLRDQRLTRARQGLESEGWTVKQAAYYVGYQHPSNFSTAYRRKFGMSPRDSLSP